MIPAMTEDGRGERWVIQCCGEARDSAEGRPPNVPIRIAQRPATAAC